VDGWSADAAGIDAERKEDEHPECPAGAIRFSGVYIVFGPWPEFRVDRRGLLESPSIAAILERSTIPYPSPTPAIGLDDTRIGAERTRIDSILSRP
jgi:hypothetical protein